MQNQPPQNDTLYLAFEKSLYKRTGTEADDNLVAMINADPHADNSTMVNISAGSIGSGTGTGMTSFSSGGIQSGKQEWLDTKAGFFFGIDTDGVAKLNMGNAISFVKWDGVTLTISGTLTAGSLNIPDTTTANSFHVDSSGNVWWGTNIATGYATALAKILS